MKNIVHQMSSLKQKKGNTNKKESTFKLLLSQCRSANIAARPRFFCSYIRKISPSPSNKDASNGRSANIATRPCFFRWYIRVFSPSSPKVFKKMEKNKLQHRHDHPTTTGRKTHEPVQIKGLPPGVDTLAKLAVAVTTTITKNTAATLPRKKKKSKKKEKKKIKKYELRAKTYRAND